MCGEKFTGSVWGPMVRFLDRDEISGSLQPARSVRHLGVKLQSLLFYMYRWLWCLFALNTVVHYTTNHSTYIRVLRLENILPLFRKIF
jgi:hypothetical protein